VFLLTSQDGPRPPGAARDDLVTQGFASAEAARVGAAALAQEEARVAAHAARGEEAVRPRTLGERTAVQEERNRVAEERVEAQQRARAPDAFARLQAERLAAAEEPEPAPEAPQVVRARRRARAQEAPEPDAEEGNEETSPI